ncbi:MAG: DUF4143 domain-containing protein [Actinobacteria bacterium]|nr:DUF4143 domain-containing protein [Actinomycetota bacterium]
MEYRPRALEPLLAELLTELPALLLVGPRATGKTTTAGRYVTRVVRLDRPAEAAAFRSDPDAALKSIEGPVLLDEWQAVPQVLGAVKRAVDAGAGPGRFLLTGSVRAQLDSETWPGTGRLVRLALFGMTVREQLDRSGPAFIDRVLGGADLEVPAVLPDLPGYIDLALRSGFPEAALSLSERTRDRWLESYLDQLLTRDAIELEGRRDPSKLRRYFEAFALNSAGLAEDKTIYDAAGVNHKTAGAYEGLLRDLLITDAIPAWVSNRLKRLTKASKRYVVDPALMATALGLDASGVLREGDIMGRLLDTFVVAQLRPELELVRPNARLHHLRVEGGRREVDLLIEIGGERVIAIEVKSGAAPNRSDARHLVWLRDELGDRFEAGIVFHTGPNVYGLDEKVVAAPICALWA